MILCICVAISVFVFVFSLLFLFIWLLKGILCPHYACICMSLFVRSLWVSFRRSCKLHSVLSESVSSLIFHRPCIGIVSKKELTLILKCRFFNSTVNKTITTKRQTHSGCVAFELCLYVHEFKVTNREKKTPSNANRMTCRLV